MKVHNKKILLQRRKDLRNKSTPQEILLWLKLKNSQTGVKWRRQHSIGGYIVDFYCPSEKLVIEVDGSPHAKKESIEYDHVRSKFLEGLRIQVLRFKNSEIETQTETVIRKIKSFLST